MSSPVQPVTTFWRLAGMSYLQVRAVARYARISFRRNLISVQCIACIYGVVCLEFVYVSLPILRFGTTTAHFGRLLLFWTLFIFKYDLVDVLALCFCMHTCST